MTITTEERLCSLCEPTIKMLHELHIGIHRLGYKQLAIAIPCYAMDDCQSLTKEVYPYVAQYFGYTDWHPVERAIRSAILDAWDRRVPAVWDYYFPGMKKAPSNKLFISTLAELLK